MAPRKFVFRRNKQTTTQLDKDVNKGAERLYVNLERPFYPFRERGRDRRLMSVPIMLLLF